MFTKQVMESRVGFSTCVFSLVTCSNLGVGGLSIQNGDLELLASSFHVEYCSFC